ncbi:hypothetical protein LINPERHAP2_LOCUS35073 [Linum perenne]
MCPLICTAVGRFGETFVISPPGTQMFALLQVILTPWFIPLKRWEA